MAHRVIFIGNGEFGIPALDILKRDYDLALVISSPDRPTGRKKVLTPPPVKGWAVEQGIPILQPEKIADAEKKIRELGPDVLIVASYGQIIPQGVLNLAKKGAINLHSSLLPKYRGASPIQSAIMSDDKETGVTVMLMDEKMDHGPIIAQEKAPITEQDDYTSLHAKLAKIASLLLSDYLPKWLDGSAKVIEQDHSQATIAKLITREDARIDWTQPARKIVQKIKALNPEPGTWTTLDKKSVKILKAEEVRSGRVELPGKIYAEGHDCLVKCGDYSVRLVTVQPEGKNPITGPDFLNGLKKLETKVFV